MTLRGSKMTIGKKFALTGAFLSLTTIILGTVSLAGLSGAWIWAVLLLSVLSGAGLQLAMVRGINRTLAKAVSEIGSGAAQVASAATQISSSSQALAQGSSEQAASLEETSSSSEEINSMAHKNTENTRAAADLAGRLRSAARRRGGRAGPRRGDRSAPPRSPRAEPVPEPAVSSGFTLGQPAWPGVFVGSLNRLQ